jgi:hypothetical protein
MEFLSPAQEATYTKIAPWLEEMFAAQLRVLPDMPVFEITLGSTFAFVQVAPWNEDATITARAYVVSGAKLAPDLQLFLLRENDTMRFGAFGVDEAGDITFQHSIVGSTCDKNELRETVAAVITIADRYDDQIVDTWGGKRGLDYQDEEKSTATGAAQEEGGATE